MSISFPTGLDDLANPLPGQSLSGHDALHGDISDALLAIETKIGINGSADTSSLDYIIKKQIGVPVVGEVLTGADGLETDFVLTYTPVTNSVSVFQNGIRLTVTNDYTITGSTITFLTAPLAVDTLIACYNKQI